MNFTEFIGCMTGTSCDGLDIAHLKTDGNKIFKIGASRTHEFDDEFKNRLRARVNLGVATSPGDARLSDEISGRHIKLIERFIADHGLKIDAIGTHGQTAWHDPAKKTSVQLGNARAVADYFKIPVVARFRQNDLNRGGQGAPLAPVYHLALARLARLPTTAVFVNVGGIANVTFIGDDALLAGDVGPGNALIDDFMLARTGTPMDLYGETAMGGRVNEAILSEWKKDGFFAKPLPKSLDRGYFRKFLNDAEKLSLKDGAATLTALTGFGIVDALKKLPKPGVTVVCGGGRHNKFITRALRHFDPKTVGSETLGVNPDTLEAQMIAYLTARFFYGLPTSFPGTTGVRSPTVGGEAFAPRAA